MAILHVERRRPALREQMGPVPYSGRIRIDPLIESAMTTGDSPVEIDDLDGRSWNGMRVKASSILEDADVYLVTLMEGNRAGHTATARLSYADDTPNRACLTGREPFTAPQDFG
jgi:hypothetical protein